MTPTESLIAKGWPELQAKAIAATLSRHDFGDDDCGPFGAARWRGRRLAQLRDWCSANAHDYETEDGQLKFLDYELRNTYQGIGTALRDATNKDDAIAAIKPFYGATFLRWLDANESAAQRLDQMVEAGEITGPQRGLVMFARWAVTDVTQFEGMGGVDKDAADKQPQHTFNGPSEPVRSPVGGCTADRLSPAPKPQNRPVTPVSRSPGGHAA